MHGGTYHGYDADPWLCECWFLNLTGAVQTFLVRINNTSGSLRSYDTIWLLHLTRLAITILFHWLLMARVCLNPLLSWVRLNPITSGLGPPAMFIQPILTTRLLMLAYSLKGYKTLVVSLTFSDPLPSMPTHLLEIIL